MYGYRPYYPMMFTQSVPKTSSALSLASIQKWTGTAQQFIKTANSFLPYVQQYGPLVKNFPMMWKLYKAFSETEAVAEKEVNDDQVAHAQAEPIAEPVKTYESIPKLYL
ncbi:YqfQ family protein [Jeotgalibacillus terrae]|uniref:YqfQ family protein n=1 Tax=Jeotgalibacillus terrae TaxID=587735 RepID=A0ABW5ZJZ7_9BACL|nr:YqfQ family protein [Jeotgalibacillus terrae]MBM7577612.1 hypothetical protein [Jeotgalibacillus terrae]